MSNADGGPAFPRAKWNSNGVVSGGVYGYDSGADGMSLRDYFAGQALALYVAEGENEEHRWSAVERLAKWSYKLADAMLAERVK